MADLKPFFDVVRAKFGTLSQSQVDGFNTVLALSDGLPLQHRAYILSTCWHETAATMQPIAEYGKGAGKPYAPLYYGRGYVQLTWQANYAKASNVVGVDLVANPDLALRPDIAGQVLINGMTAGWFTGKKLSDFPAGDYFHMRQIVNGMDRAALIAGYAQAFELALKNIPSAIPIPGSTSVTLPPVTAPVASLSLWERLKWLWLKLAVIFTPPRKPAAPHFADLPAPVPDALLSVPETIPAFGGSEQSHEVDQMSLSPEEIERAFQTHMNGGIAGAQQLFGINLHSADKVRKTFCQAWPEVKKLFDDAVGFAAFIPGASTIAPEAKAFMAVVEQMFIPVACPVAAAAPAPGTAPAAPVTPSAPLNQ